MSDVPEPAGSAGLLISGAGSVGSALALAAARAGVPVTLIEKRKEEGGRRDPRLFALSEPSWRWLGEIGVLNHLGVRASPIREILVEEPGHPPVRLDALDVDLPVLGYTVWASQLEDAFGRAVRSEPGIRFLPGTQIESLVAGRGGADCRLQTPQGAGRLIAPLVVIAEGRPPGWALGFGMRSVEEDTGRTALVIPLATRLRPVFAQAYEQLAGDSLLAILPAATARSVVTWTLPRAAARRFIEAPPAGRRGELARRIGCNPEAIVWDGDPASFDLLTRRVDPPCADRVLLIGNAAHSIVPFAAQGLNLALRDARHLVSAFVSSRTAGQDWGSREWTARFWTGRARDHRRVDGLTVGLPRLFALKDPLSRLIRSGGWAVVARSPGIQRRILMRGLGWNP